MKALYQISPGHKANGANIVHTDGCPLLPGRGKTTFLGIFNSPEEAMKEAAIHFKKTDCCPFCLKEHYLKRKKPVFAGLFDQITFITSDGIAAAWESAMICGVN